jgi:copper homeostasis protein CutC
MGYKSSSTPFNLHSLSRSNYHSNCQQPKEFYELKELVDSGRIVIVAGGGVIRSFTTALAKQLVNRNGVHISFSEPTADEELNPEVLPRAANSEQ